jgi:hypothetical protein
LGKRWEAEDEYDRGFISRAPHEHENVTLRRAVKQIDNGQA